MEFNASNTSLFSAKSTSLLNLLPSAPSSEESNSLDSVRSRSRSISLETIPDVFLKKTEADTERLLDTVERTQQVLKKNPFYITKKSQQNAIFQGTTVPESSIISLNSTRLHVINQEEKKVNKNVLKVTSRAHAAAVILPDIINSTAKIGKRMGKSILYGQKIETLRKLTNEVLMQNQGRDRSAEKIARNMARAFADPLIAAFQGTVLIIDSPRSNYMKKKIDFKGKVARQRSQIELKLKEVSKQVQEMKSIHSIVMQGRHLAVEFNEKLQYLTSITDRNNPEYLDFKTKMESFMQDVQAFQDNPSFYSMLDEHHCRRAFVSCLKLLEGQVKTYEEMEKLEMIADSIEEQNSRISILLETPTPLSASEVEELESQIKINQVIVESFHKNFPLNGTVNDEIPQTLAQVTKKLEEILEINVKASQASA